MFDIKPFLSVRFNRRPCWLFDLKASPIKIVHNSAFVKGNLRYFRYLIGLTLEIQGVLTALYTGKSGLVNSMLIVARFSR